MKIYFISHVRQSTPELYERERVLVEALEKVGHVVHWPIRDTDQDRMAVAICGQNLAAIESADVVLIAGLTQGQVFDLGMAFALAKTVFPVPGLFPERTEGKSFENLVREMPYRLNQPEMRLWKSLQEREIASIVESSPEPAANYETAAGVLKGMFDPRPEDVIRKIRDAE